MEQQIRHFKLLNGDDVIAILVSYNHDNYIIEEPVMLNSNVTGNYHLTKWFPLSPQKAFKLYKTRVMQHVPVYEDVSESYVEYLMSLRDNQTEDHQPLVQSYKELMDTLISQSAEYRKETDEYSDDDYYPLPDDNKEPTVH